MELKRLIKDIKPMEIKGSLDIDIKKLAYDSRQVKKGSLFICIKGFKNDGHDFITSAVQNGARALLILQLIGVTGTNGKTTTTYLIKAILEKGGIKTGLIGTIKIIIGDKTLPATRTTPESLDLYELFAKMVEAGISHVVMEVSSHALDLKRVTGMGFQIAVFTNITQDHLDYHKSIADYLKAKMRLFQQVKDNGTAVINIDDLHSQEIIKASRGRIITYGTRKNGDLLGVDITISPQGAAFQLQGIREFAVKIKLTGLFNVYNSLAAISCGIALGLSNQEIKEGLEGVNGVDGRFELINEGQDFAVIVDYAHTPDGMENVLKTALEFIRGNIIIVFGCGGDRDRMKRPMMGQIAAKYGGITVITSDNPRSEEPLEIIKEIESGIKINSRYIIKPDRREAIFYAINQAVW